MYASAQERAEGIEATAQLPPTELRDDFRAAVERLIADVDQLPADAWDAEILTARGRAVPASEVLWMRVRETRIHTVDLDAGAQFSDQPTAIVAALLADIAAGPAAATADPPLKVTAVDLDRSWRLGSGEPVEVSGPSAALLTWLSGRGDGADLRTAGAPAAPTPPRWL
jgi:maleylpyruvate isomerase